MFCVENEIAVVGLLVFIGGLLASLWVFFLLKKLQQVNSSLAAIHIAYDAVTNLTALDEIDEESVHAFVVWFKSISVGEDEVSRGHYDKDAVWHYFLAYCLNSTSGGAIQIVECLKKVVEEMEEEAENFNCFVRSDGNTPAELIKELKRLAGALEQGVLYTPIK